MSQPRIIESRAWCRLYRRAYRDLMLHGWGRRDARHQARDYANLVFHGTIYPRK